MAEERVAMSSSNSSSLHAPQSWYQELEVALDSSSATINQLNENVESLYRRIQGSDQPLAIFLAAYWRVGAGSLCCLHAAAGRGQGDEGGHLDTEEEEVPQPMSSILEDLESREAMRFQLCGDLDHCDWVLAEISTLAKMCEKILKLTADAKFVWPSTVSMADASPVNCSSWGYPKSTWPACATVMRRNKAPCRSTWGLQPTQQV
ncbi:uncharacterized protein LOC114679448 isoform X5 [Macaca mulatta]